MRQIINISLPEPLADIVNQAVKNKYYASKSEFFRDLIRDWSKNESANEILKSHQEMKKGQKNLLKSFKDLRNL
jgi:Arc/MetJ-type ribon-helix-helix transcriptional regulator